MKVPHLGAALGLALALPGCYDFHIVGPEDPEAVKSPLTASVSVLYQQPAACVNSGSPCDGPVTFHASWMRIGDHAILVQSSPHTWVATIKDVPVNFPGVDPHRVYAVDPYLLDTRTGGVSADRLTIGGERIVKFENPGGVREQGLIYIDANGRGRTPQ
jgi:hypothetical protein